MIRFTMFFFNILRNKIVKFVKFVRGFASLGGSLELGLRAIIC